MIANSTPSYSGQDAPLNEDGYQEVASLKNDNEMKVYVRRVLQAAGKEVINEGDLSGFVPWYSGTNATQSFDALKSELGSASWVTSAGTSSTGTNSTPSYSGHGAPLNEDGYKEVANLKNNNEMKAYVRRVLQAAGKEVINEGDLSGFVPWYSGSNATQSLEALKSELGSASWVTSAGTNSTGTNSTPSYSGQDAPLNEDGYQEVASLKNDNEMKVYVRRVLQAAGKEVINEGNLSGFVLWYSGSNATQSFEALTSELGSASWVSSAGTDSDPNGPMLCKRAAQEQVMCEFPEVFNNSGWNPDEICAGHSAGDRAAWLMRHEVQDMCEKAAQAQVMCEYPDAFAGGEWNASAVCGEDSAGDRALWLLAHSGKQ